jgi:hypothetical protein
LQQSRRFSDVRATTTSLCAAPPARAGRSRARSDVIGPFASL